jgi:antitoxin component YwqK of YwqJK toxin-antitoxin module
MKKSLLGMVVLALLSISTHAETKKYYDSGALHFIFPTKINGKLEGTVTEFYKNGNVKYKWSYHKGFKHGVAKKYEKGHLKYTWFYKWGERSLTTKEFHRDGTLKKKWKENQCKMD